MKKNYQRDVFLLVLINALLLILPAVNDPQRLLGRMDIYLFLLLASAFCLSEGLLSVSDQLNSLSELPALDRWLPRLSGLVLLSIYWISLIDALKANTIHSNFILMIFGGGLMGGGIILRRIAMVTLGRQFQSAPSPILGANLITVGIFSHLRHPSEAGLLTIAIGTCVILGSITGAILTLTVFLPLTFIRVRREEIELRQHIGSAYDNYAASAGGVCPDLIGYIRKGQM
jgi:protein-S-isoprenylcysteine O-methyltransferase Ste14